MGWILDLDGVIWRGSEPVPGSPEAVARLLQAGEDVVFVTNNAGLTVATFEQKLASMGIAGDGRVVSSAMAAGRLVQPGQRVLVCGGPGLVEAVEAAGATPHEGDPRDAEVVVVGFHPFDYSSLTRAHVGICAGALFVATNADASYPVEEGTVPGNGAMVAALAASTGVRPIVAGKPDQPIVDLLHDRLGDVGVVVGDRPDTDGLLARRLGWDFALVLSGVVGDADGVDPAPDHVADDLGGIVDRLLG